MHNTVVLTAASYRLLCPNCGREHLHSTVQRYLECPCGKMVATEGPVHRFDDDREELGVWQAASYQYSCPDCDGTQFEARVVERVTCDRCGARLEVESATHNSNLRLL